MTRRVNFEPQQRVDQPDATAISTFGVQDLRRILRKVVMGKDAEPTGAGGSVLQGFAVEPTSPVSSRVLVKMALPGGLFSAFMGAVNEAGTIDWGQLAGDQDGAGNMEGSSQNLLDFAGQPAGSYDVKARVTFAKGVTDNRAFWNPSTGAEYVKTTNTRLLPQWEIAYAGHSSAEWVLLATVTWNSVSIGAADITDKRRFALEGTPRPGVAADFAFSHDTQDNAGTYGVSDFDRSTDRMTTGVGISAIWEMLRALARQIQDLKGGRTEPTNDARFDWYSRVFQPPGFVAANPATVQTKSLRTVDTVTFTCADGTTEQGDFNGNNAVNDCFSFIQNNAAALPDSIRIVVKSRQGAGAFTWKDAVLITDKVIHVSGIGVTSSYSPLFSANRGFVELTASSTLMVSGTLLQISGTASRLIMENIYFADAPDGVTQLVVDPGNSVELNNCMFFKAQGYNDTIAPVVRLPSESMRLTDCVFYGTSNIGGRLDPGLTTVYLQDMSWAHGIAQRCVFNGLVRLVHTDLSGTAYTERWRLANSLTFKHCLFNATTTSQVGGSVARGSIDVSGTRHVRFDACDFLYSGSQDCIRGISLLPQAATTWQNVEDLRVRNCLFQIIDAATHTGFASGAGGVNLTDGTGWAIDIQAQPAATAVVDIQQLPRGIVIERNEFISGLDVTETFALPTSPDAGAIRVVDGIDVTLQRNKIRKWTYPLVGSASDTQKLISADATLAGVPLGGGQYYDIVGNHINDFLSSGSSTWNGQKLLGIHMHFIGQSSCYRNKISAANFAVSTSFTRVGTARAGALMIETCYQVAVEDNEFTGWRDSGSPLSSTCVTIMGIVHGINVSRNKFYNCGGWNITHDAATTANVMRYHSNECYVGNDTSKFHGILGANNGGTANSMDVSHNFWDYPGGTPQNCIELPSTLNWGIVVGNMAKDGDIFLAGASGSPVAGVIGYGVLLNAVNAYT